MDKKTLAKLAVLAKKDPKVAEALSKQASAISDDELEQVAGGDVCALATCIFDSDCWGDTNHKDASKYCDKVSDDSKSYWDGPI